MLITCDYIQFLIQVEYKWQIIVKRFFRRDKFGQKKQNGAQDSFEFAPFVSFAQTEGSSGSGAKVHMMVMEREFLNLNDSKYVRWQRACKL